MPGEHKHCPCVAASNMDAQVKFLDAVGLFGKLLASGPQDTCP